MKLLARADFYQQKMKELEKLDLQFEMKKASYSSETPDSGNSALSSLQDQLATNKLKIKPKRIRIWYFDYACKKAMMFAEHYGFDIRCEIGGGWGHIQLWADMLYSDASWKEGKYLRMLFSILHNADIVTIEPASDEQSGQIHIDASFRLVHITISIAISNTFSHLLGKHAKQPCNKIRQKPIRMNHIARKTYQ